MKPDWLSQCFRSLLYKPDVTSQFFPDSRILHPLLPRKDGIEFIYWITSLRKISKDHLSHFLTIYSSIHIENKCTWLFQLFHHLYPLQLSLSKVSLWSSIGVSKPFNRTWRACCRLWASKCSAWVKPLGIEDHISVALQRFMMTLNPWTPILMDHPTAPHSNHQVHQNMFASHKDPTYLPIL